jgi:hypothetical protein
MPLPLRTKRSPGAGSAGFALEPFIRMTDQTTTATIASTSGTSGTESRRGAAAEQSRRRDRRRTSQPADMWWRPSGLVRVSLRNVEARTSRASGSSWFRLRSAVRGRLASFASSSDWEHRRRTNGTGNRCRIRSQLGPPTTYRPPPTSYSSSAILKKNGISTAAVSGASDP